MCADLSHKVRYIIYVNQITNNTSSKFEIYDTTAYFNISAYLNYDGIMW